MNKIRENFHTMIRKVLREEIEKRDAVIERVPEMNGNGVDRTKDKTKTFASDENPRDRMSKDQLIADLTKTVKSINPDYPVVWDDHDDLKIDARDLMSIIITPDWEDHYVVEVMTRNEDRLWVTGLDWNQVKAFVKRNLAPADKKEAPTKVEKAYDKSYRNMQDQTEKSDKGMPKQEVKVKTVGTASNKEKDFNEKQNKEVDNPDQPMKEVKEFKRQEEMKVKDPVKLRKKVPDKKLVVKQS